MKGKKKLKSIILTILLIVVVIFSCFIVTILLKDKENKVATKPEDIIYQYFSLIEKKEYEIMYSMISEESKKNYTLDEFIDRNQNIYEGIGAKKIKVNIIGVEKISKEEQTVTYEISQQSMAGEIRFENTQDIIVDLITIFCQRNSVYSIYS